MKPERHIHFLFVCNANMNRSATGEHLARSLGFSADSVGSRPDLLFGRPLTKESIDQVQRIACLEPHHRDAVVALAPERVDDIDVLNIPDIYPYCHPELLQRLRPYLATFHLGPKPPS